MTKKQKKAAARILLCAVLLIPANLIPFPFLYRAGVFLALYLLIGWDILKKAALGIIHLQPFDENLLMALASLGAFALALFSKNADFNEAITVVLLYQVGELFESIAVGKSRKSIQTLMNIRPDRANLEKDGEILTVSPEEVPVGSVITVSAGERIPLDGEVISGESALDTSALTGESLPREIKVGDKVQSGCVNLSGLLKVRTEKEAGQSTAAKILELVSSATSKKSRSEQFISKFARVYTPTVVLSALALAVLPPLFLLLTGKEAMFSTWLYRALSFLVISCPCALVISIPLSFFAGIGKASREGILIKGSGYLETLSSVRSVVFDKTGTLTKGVFEVCGIHHAKRDEKELLRLAAMVESASTHPIAKSLLRALGEEPDRSEISDVTEYSGQGVIGTVRGHVTALGNEKLMERIGVAPISCHSIGTVLHLAVDGEYQGHIVIADKVKDGAAEAVRKLKALGVGKTVMLTGDSRTVAEKVGKELGIDTVHAGLLPSDKVEIVEKLLAGKEKKTALAFVGDGINDAPVLARADLGIAMGGLGSDAAIEAADIVLMDDDPKKIALALGISRKCHRIVLENIIFALSVKFLCLILAAFGITTMWTAIFADVGVMILAVLNSLRCFRN